jgi:lysyl-tRNA synthetase class 1
MYHKPREAKRLYFDVIPRAVDEYYAQVSAYWRQDPAMRLSNPVWHIHAGEPPEIDLPVSFALLLNLATVAHAETKDVLWGCLRRHFPEVSPATPDLDRLVGYALSYFRDFVKPRKRYRPADEIEREALETLSEALAQLPAGASAEDIQAVLYDVGRAVPRYQNPDAKGSTPDKPGVSLAWFNALYQILLGEEKGPRFGSFVALYGIDNTRELIAAALSGDLTRAPL